MQALEERENVAIEEEDDEVDVHGSDFRQIEELQEHGINASDINKLKEAGFITVGSVLQKPMKELLSIKGLSEAKATKIRDICKKLGGSDTSFMTGIECRERRKRVVQVTTGSKQLDAILGGGIETASITEFFGEFRTGKTQIAHTLCVTSQLAYDANGGQGKAIYVDTEGNFRPQRIEAIAERFGLDAEETLENIVVARVYTHEQQIDIMSQIAGLCVDDGPFRVLIVDSVIGAKEGRVNVYVVPCKQEEENIKEALFRTEYSGRGELSERQQKLGKHMADLVRLAEEFNLAVMIVNQCMADPGAMAMFGPSIKPVGGHVLAHASTTRVFLKKASGDERIAKIYDSPSMPEAEGRYTITEGGISDVS